MALPSRHSDSLRQVVRDPRILDGEPTIEGTRIPVRSIVQVFEAEGSIDIVAEAFPPLDHRAIEQALSFYQSHRREIDTYIAENQDDLPS